MKKAVGASGRGKWVKSGETSSQVYLASSAYILAAISVLMQENHGPWGL